MAEFEFTTAAWLSIALLVTAAIVALALIVYLVRQARSGRGRAVPAEEERPPRTLEPGESATLAALLEGGRDPEPFLMRFVTDAGTGERAGESIAVADDRLVLKRGAGFAAVPLERVLVKDDALSVRDVDWTEAERAGEAWKSAHESRVEYDDQGNPVA